MAQKPPIRVDAPKADSDNPAVFIFLHGYGDDAEGFVDIAHQFHSASKLPHLTWIFPNAPHNRESMTNAWYTPTSFTPIPTGSSSGPTTSSDEIVNPEADEDEESENEILQSVEYICGLIDAEVEKGVMIERIVVGGFSQGCAVSLVLGLASRSKGRVGGVVGLSGYFPRGRRIWEGRQELRKRLAEGSGDEKGMKVFLAHGTKDMLVPMRVFREAGDRVKATMGKERVVEKVYEGMGHVASGAEFRDMCTFLEEVIPE